MKSGTAELLAGALLVLASLLSSSALGAESDDAAVSAMVPGYERLYASRPSVVAGRLLLAELSCTACHASRDADLRAKGGPRLDGVGNRLQRDWVRRFLLDPQAAKAGATMPHLLHGYEDEQRLKIANALAAYLSAQRRPFPEIPSTALKPVLPQVWTKGDPAHGRLHYHRIGCVACHEPETEFEPDGQIVSKDQQLLKLLSDEELEELGWADTVRPVRSVPLGRLKEKYSLLSLTHFLLAPQATRPAGRMPSLNLDPQEAADLAAYLLGSAARANLRPATPVESLAMQGARWYSQLGCAACHPQPEKEYTPSAKSLGALDAGAAQNCLSQPGEAQPKYSLDANQRTSIEMALRDLDGREAVGATPEGSLQYRFAQLNCFACHQRSRRGGLGLRRWPYFETVGRVDLGDEGRIPPQLDGVGRKLHKGWLDKVIAGQGRVRPHMTIRMPSYSQPSLAGISELLIRADRPNPGQRPAPPRATPASLEAGRAIVGTGCIQCHPLQGDQLPGVVGIDLADVAQRIQPDWFRDFLLNPGALKPRTRMPTFFPNGKSSLPELLDGDSEAQIAAVWNYLRDLKTQPLPEKLEAGKEHRFEVRPQDEPVVMRTFMAGVGTHAVAVGFPERVHYAFDSEQPAPVLLWKGRFLNAHSTWFNRFVPPTAPLGESLVRLPPGPSAARLGTADAAWPQAADVRFRGYALDENGAPGFRYEGRGWRIEDRLTPGKDGAVRRILAVRRLEPFQDASALWVRLLSGPGLELLGKGKARNALGVEVEVVAVGLEAKNLVMAKPPQANAAELRLQIPLPAAGSRTIEVLYRW